MHRIALPQRLYRQPQYRAVVDYGNPLSVSLTHASIYPDANASGLAKWARNGSILYNPSSIGIVGAFGNSASNYLSCTQTPTYVNGVGYTVAGYALLNNSGNSVFIITSDDAVDRAFQFRVSASAPQFIALNTSASAFTGQSSSISVGRYYFYVGRVSNTGEVSVWVNGVKGGTVATLTGTIQAPKATALRVGVRTTSASDGDVGATFMWNRALSDAEIVSLSSNPWQIFSPINKLCLGVPAAIGAYTLTADSSSFALTGTAATLTAQRKVTADSGSFTLTGTAAVLSHNHVLAANSGSIALTGTAATLTYTPVGGYTLSANGGSFSLSGTAASLIASRKIVIGEGAFSLVGTDANLQYSVGLTDSQKIDLILDILSNKQTLDSSTGLYTLYADDGVTVLYTTTAWEDAAGTVPYRGKGLARLDALT